MSWQSKRKVESHQYRVVKTGTDGGKISTQAEVSKKLKLKDAD